MTRIAVKELHSEQVHGDDLLSVVLACTTVESWNRNPPDALSRDAPLRSTPNHCVEPFPTVRRHHLNIVKSCFKGVGLFPFASHTRHRLPARATGMSGSRSANHWSVACALR